MAEGTTTSSEGPTAETGSTAVWSTTIGEKPGDAVGPYRLLSVLGEGGFGVVYLAERREPIVQRVALKIIKPGMDSRAVIARFEQERQALAVMDHPNVAKVYDAGATASGRPYFVMELVQGEPITLYCDRQRLTIRQRLEVFIRVCEAVQHAHMKGIIHRDIKPSNILVTIKDAQPIPKVIDFGVAKAISQTLTEKTIFTKHGELIGTPEYMSPEQAEMGGTDVDTRTDVYSLGVVLYQLLTGALPFDSAYLRSKAYDEIRRIIREEPAPRPSTKLTSAGDGGIEIARNRQAQRETLVNQLRKELEWIPLKAVRKDRTDRYETPKDLADDIWRYLRGQPLNAGPESARYRFKKWALRNRGPVAAVAAVIVVLMAGIAGVTVALARERDQARRALAAEIKEKERADELSKVVDFQSGQLSGVNTALMGTGLREDLIAQRRGALIRANQDEQAIHEAIEQLDDMLGDVNFTSLALNALDDNIFQRALEAIQNQFAGQPLVRARLLQTLATTMRDLGLLDRANAPQQEALEIFRRQLGPEDLLTVTSIENLGLLFHKQSRFADAERCYRDVQEKRLRLLGPEHRDTLMAISNLGLVLQAQGQLDEAEQQYGTALETCRRALGNDDQTTVGLINNMGFLREAQGKWKDAEQFYREGLDIDRRLLGDDNPDTLMLLDNLGRILRFQARFPEAEECTREALERRRRVFGDEHPDTLSSLSNLAAVLRAQDKFAEAEPCYREALTTSQRVLGRRHADTVRALNNLGVFLSSQNKLDQAEECFRETLEWRRLTLGDLHAETLNTVFNLGSLLQKANKLDEAEPYLREAAETAPKILGHEHPHTLMCQTGLSRLLQARGKLDEAESCQRAVLEVQRRLLGPEHADTLNSLVLLGSILQEKSNLEEAETYLREALATRRRVHGNDHTSTLQSINNLASLLCLTGELDEAEALIREAVEACRRALGEENPNTLICVVNLGKLLTRKNRPKESVELLAPAEAAARKAFTAGAVPQLGLFLLNLGKARVDLRQRETFALAESNLLEAHEILLKSFGPKRPDVRDCQQALIDLYDTWHTAEPGNGYDLKATEWKTALTQLEASSQPASQPATQPDHK